ncbi:MAG: hypothetical protein J1D87_08205 [Lachnospiraceae bacterium]|nr:hypothetical protein [Lachnospiraceae bacterium]
MKIKIKETELNVNNFYPFRYPDGKLVLRFDVSADDADFNTLYELLSNNQSPIEYYENSSDEAPQCTYYGYSEFSANYTNGKYSVEQITPNTLKSEIQNLQAQLTAQSEIINHQNQTISELTDFMREIRQSKNVAG